MENAKITVPKIVEFALNKVFENPQKFQDIMVPLTRTKQTPLTTFANLQTKLYNTPITIRLKSEETTGCFFLWKEVPLNLCHQCDFGNVYGCEISLTVMDKLYQTIMNCLPLRYLILKEFLPKELITEEFEDKWKEAKKTGDPTQVTKQIVGDKI